MPAFKPKEVARILEKLGFVPKRQAGSHLVMYNHSSKQIISVPLHTKDVKKGLLHSIIKKAKSTEEEFLRLK